MLNTKVVSAAHFDPKLGRFLGGFLVAVKSEFVIYEVFLHQCGKADTIKDYTGGGSAHMCFPTQTD